MARRVTYKGIPMRSETEGRWAHMFDSMGWAWKYEPETLNGYIPDFVLLFPEPLLFEVKPAYHPMACLGLGREKLVRSGWQKEAVISCVDFMRSEYQPGKVAGVIAERARDAWDFGVAEVGWCKHGQHFGIHHGHGSYHCRTCGHQNGPSDWDYGRGSTLERYSTDAYKFFRYDFGGE